MDLALSNTPGFIEQYGYYDPVLKDVYLMNWKNVFGANMALNKRVFKLKAN